MFWKVLETEIKRTIFDKNVLKIKISVKNKFIIKAQNVLKYKRFLATASHIQKKIYVIFNLLH